MSGNSALTPGVPAHGKVKYGLGAGMQVGGVEGFAKEVRLRTDWFGGDVHPFGRPRFGFSEPAAAGLAGGTHVC